MSPRWLVVPAAAALLLGGCGGSGDPSSRPEESTGSEPTTAKSPAQSPRPDPLRFRPQGGRTVYSCFPDGPRHFLFLGQVHATREVTLTGVRGGRTVRTHGGWVTPLSRGQVPRSGAVDVDAPGADLVSLPGRERRVRLRGAVLDPDREYTYVVRATVRPDRSLDDLVLGWDDGDVTGQASTDVRGRTRRGGC